MIPRSKCTKSFKGCPLVFGVYKSVQCVQILDTLDAFVEIGPQ